MFNREHAMLLQSFLGNWGKEVHYSVLGAKHLHGGIRGDQYSMGPWFGKPYWPVTQQPLGEQIAVEIGFRNTPSDLALCRARGF